VSLDPWSRYITGYLRAASVSYPGGVYTRTSRVCPGSAAFDGTYTNSTRPCGTAPGFHSSVPSPGTSTMLAEVRARSLTRGLGGDRGRGREEAHEGESSHGRTAEWGGTVGGRTDGPSDPHRGRTVSDLIVCRPASTVKRATQYAPQWSR